MGLDVMFCAGQPRANCQLASARGIAAFLVADEGLRTHDQYTRCVWSISVLPSDGVFSRLRGLRYHDLLRP
jgi:hypothetical protein